VFFARDHDTARVAGRVRAAQWEPLARGAYVAAGAVTSEKDRALAQMVAVHHRVRVEHWFSHESAAVLRGLRVWRDPTTTHLRQARRPDRNPDPTVRRHLPAVPVEHRAQVSGLPVTSLEATVVDCARSLPPLDALVIADAAVRSGADLAKANALLAEMPGLPGVRAAAHVLALADPGAESAPETAVRYYMLAAGLPAPQTQVEVKTWHKTYWSDLGYPQHKLLIEYDGRSKYTGNEWLREKRRMDAIVEAGFRIVRATADDLHKPACLVARIRQLLVDEAIHPRPYLR